MVACADSISITHLPNTALHLELISVKINVFSTPIIYLC